mmetsp:Transcript_33969/g.34205  ORF Transcript_33969/g.34205 Transcript_33969/m.34205 type:complete len:86 (-) Transcript_33969:145-402(-)
MLFDMLLFVTRSLCLLCEDSDAVSVSSSPAAARQLSLVGAFVWGTCCNGRSQALLAGKSIYFHILTLCVSKMEMRLEFSPSTVHY